MLCMNNLPFTLKHAKLTAYTSILKSILEDVVLFNNKLILNTLKRKGLVLGSDKSPINGPKLNLSINTTFIKHLTEVKLLCVCLVKKYGQGFSFIKKELLHFCQLI